MSIHACPICDSVYDTDEEMNELDGEMVCTECFEETETFGTDELIKQEGRYEQ